MADTDIDQFSQVTLCETLTFWAHQLHDKSTSTVDCYLRDIRHVAHTLATTLGRDVFPSDLMNLGTSHLEKFAECWRDAPATRRRRLVSLRRYSLMLADTWGLTGPLLHAKFPKIEVRTEEPVPEEELLALAAPTGDRKDWIALRDDAILALVMEHGLTTGELHVADCGHLSVTLLLVRNASGRARFVELSAKVVDCIGSYRKLCPYPELKNGPLWVNSLGGRVSPRSLQLMMRRRRALASLPHGLVTGSFRRNRIRSLASSGIPVDRIAKRMGIGAATVLVHLKAG